jgi:hypothetical protein
MKSWYVVPVTLDVISNNLQYPLQQEAPQVCVSPDNPHLQLLTTHCRRSAPSHLLEMREIEIENGLHLLWGEIPTKPTLNSGSHRQKYVRECRQLSGAPERAQIQG